jgi:hypothetical protein
MQRFAGWLSGEMDGGQAVVAEIDARESDTRRLEPATLTAWLGGQAMARVDGPGGAAVEGPGVPLWSILLGLALALFVAESVLLS